MRHRKHTFKLGRTGAHRRAMLANMTCSLIIESQIRTTVPKAKELRRFAERMVTLGKKGSLHHRRLAISKIKDKDAVRILFDEIAPRFDKRNGGYTRILRLGRRQGDGAEMCLLQWVEAEFSEKKKKKTKKAEQKTPEVSEAVPEAEEVEETDTEKDEAEETASEETVEAVSEESSEKHEEQEKTDS